LRRRPRTSTSMSKRDLIGVMHVVDSLSFGGTEKVAVTLAGELPQDRYRAYLCSTRKLGPLVESIAPHVPLLSLNRNGRFDLSAARQFMRYVRDQNIRLLHVHSSSLFFARLATFLFPVRGVRIVWHDHWGNCESGGRNPRPYRLASRGIGGVIAVNDLLAKWARVNLPVSQDRVWYLRNFVNPAERSKVPEIPLPGTPGRRIVCVANLRPQKDHFNLIRAMKIVQARVPDVQLLLVGTPVDLSYAKSLAHEVEQSGLGPTVSFLGSQTDIFAHLIRSDIGVLSSASEGLPLSLLEYGWAALPVVSTRVGQCAEVLDNGKAGILVNPGDSEALAQALLDLLENDGKRRDLGGRLLEFVRATYSRDSVINALCGIYGTILQDSPITKEQVLTEVH
jgi:glycosyltransferase involved in cell wall biosynthesis